jgi:hypothetical protein
MNARALIALLALTLAACGGCGARTPQLTTEGWAWVPLHPRTHEPALAALVLMEGMKMPGARESEDHPLSVGLWEDGTVVSSSAAGAAYGHPYRTANIGPEVCESIRELILAVMLQREGNLVSYAILDADHEELLVRRGDRVWRMRSCIDLFEASGKVVAFSGGVAARDQMPPVDPNDPEERALLEFREAWASAKRSLLSAVSGPGSDLDLRSLEFAALGSKAR